MTTNKPTVHYKGKAQKFMLSAYLLPVDHPNHLVGHSVSNTEYVTTSKVLNWNEETGVIETKNTIYVPLSEEANG